MVHILRVVGWGVGATYIVGVGKFHMAVKDPACLVCGKAVP